MNDALLKSLTERFGSAVGYGSAEQVLISTGIPQLDAATGGIPTGRIVEIFGAEDTGKTALALHLVKQLPGPVLYIDADRGLSPYMLNGLETYLLEAEKLEDVLEVCRGAAGDGFGSIVIDTVTALPTQRDLRKRLDDLDGLSVGPAAMLLSRALPGIASRLHASGCTLILVNQLRNKPGVLYGRPDRPTGGRAIGHYAALRLETNCIGPLLDGRDVIGQKVLVRVQKNKSAPPGKRAELRLIYGEGVRA